MLNPPKLVLNHDTSGVIGGLCECLNLVDDGVHGGDVL